MAINGSFNTTTSYEGRYLRFSWSIQSQSIVNNTSTIYWELRGAGGDSTYYKSGPFKVVIDGEQVYYSENRINLYNNTLVASGTKVITHNIDGTRSFSASAEGAIYFYEVNCKGSGSWNLTPIARQAVITGADNFTDEGNPVITYSNPGGNGVTSLQACIANAGGTVTYADYREISKTGSSYTFNLTDAERNKLRAAATKNTLAVKFYVTTTIGNDIYYSTLDRTLTIVNASPTINPVIKDTGAASTELTGDPNKIIKGFNYIEFSTGAAALKGASIVSQKVACGNQVISSANGVFNNVDSGKFVITVVDSRGNSTTQTFEKTLIDYVNLTCNIDMNNPTAEGDLAFKISGRYFNGSFGATDNALTLEWRYRENDEAYGSWIAVTPTINKDNSYETIINLSNLNYQSTYTFQARAIDKVETTGVFDEVKVKTAPIFDWGEDDFYFSVPVSIQGANVDTIVEQGTSGIWTYRKWASGVAECWGWYQGTISLPNNMAGVYYSPSTVINYPFPFVENCLTVTGGSMTTVNWARSFADTTNYASFIVVANEQQNNVVVIVQLQAKGRWK